MNKLVFSLLALSSISAVVNADEVNKQTKVWTWSEASFNATDVNFVTAEQNKKLGLNAPAYTKKNQNFKTVYLPQVVPVNADRSTCAQNSKCSQPWLSAEEVALLSSKQQTLEKTKLKN